ncbi:MAG: hypothetical protein WCL08_00285 [Verrucomicrobiota bacterium]|jgi:type IV secretory pathway TrbF-like protein
MTLSFPCNRDQFTKVREAFAARGILVNDDTHGMIAQDGVTAQYDEDGTTLNVTILDKPWYASDGMVRSHLSDFINEAINS